MRSPDRLAARSRQIQLLEGAANYCSRTEDRGQRGLRASDPLSEPPESAVENIEGYRAVGRPTRPSPLGPCPGPRPTTPRNRGNFPGTSRFGGEIVGNNRQNGGAGSPARTGLSPQFPELRENTGNSPGSGLPRRAISRDLSARAGAWPPVSLESGTGNFVPRSRDSRGHDLPRKVPDSRGVAPHCDRSEWCGRTGTPRKPRAEPGPGSLPRSEEVGVPACIRSR